MSQLRCSGFVWAVVIVDDDSAGEVEGEAVDEADLVVRDGALNNAVHFARGTRRLGEAEESEARRVAVELL